MRLSDDDLFLLHQCAVSAACQAGHAIARYSPQAVAVKTKNGGASRAAQVVTEVDLICQEIILAVLQPTCAMFDLALLSEECPDDGQRLHKDFFWSIDPLDGTLPFIEGVPGYSVSIALVSRDGQPIIGVVYDPNGQTLYHAVKGKAAWRNQETLGLPEPCVRSGQQLVFLTDKSFAKDPLYADALIEMERIAGDLGYAGATLRLQGGAAMNACQVLDNPASCYFKLPKPQVGGGSVWDYAATACLFSEFGAHVSDSLGQPLVLNPPLSTFMNHCGVLYCADAEVANRMIDFYRRVQNTG